MKHLLPLVLAGLLGGTPPLHGRILFEAQHTLRQGALVVMDADGTHRTRVAGAASGMVVIATRGAYAYSRLDGRGEHVVVVDADGKHAFGPGRPAAFSPDGRTLVVQEQDGTCVLRDTHTGLVQHTFPATMGFFGWSPGGLLFAQPSGDLLVTQPDGSGEHTVAHPVGDLEAAWSPDGAWIAYASDESGRWEVFARRLADGRRVPISTNGGQRPCWSRDGQSILFEDGARLLRARFSAEREPRAQAPDVVFAQPGARVLDVSGDGRFLVEQQPPVLDRAIVTTEWLRELRQRVPPPVTAPR